MLHKPRLSELRTVARNKVEKPKNCFKKTGLAIPRAVVQDKTEKIENF